MTSNTSYAEMYREIQYVLNIDPSQYDIELRFLFNNEHTSIPIPLTKVTSRNGIKALISLNEARMTTPVCVTLVKKNVPESEHEDLDGGDRNVNDFWNTVEIARENDVVIPTTVIHHHGITVTHRIPSIVDDNENENEFTNEDLIALSGRRHGSGSQAGMSSRTSNCSRTVPEDEDLYVEQLFETRKDLQEAVHRITLRHNFEFKVKKSDKSTYTIICIDDSCHWRLRATKMDTNEFFVIRKCARGTYLRSGYSSK